MKQEFPVARTPDGYAGGKMANGKGPLTALRLISQRLCDPLAGIVEGAKGPAGQIRLDLWGLPYVLQVRSVLGDQGFQTDGASNKRNRFPGGGVCLCLYRRHDACSPFNGTRSHRVARRCRHRPAPSERRMQLSPQAAQASQTPHKGSGQKTVRRGLRSDFASLDNDATGRL